MEAANTVIGKVADLLFSAAKQEIDHVRNCSKNVDKLRKEVEKLKDMKGRVQQQIDRAKGKGDDLLEGVQRWIDQAGVEVSMAEDFLEQEANAKKTCFNLRWCVNLSTLSHYSKTATNKALSLIDHREGGKDFEDRVSIPTSAPRDIDLYQRKNYDQIHSHKLLLNKIVASIEDESIQIVGIYGVGGVGKTTLAKEVAAQMKKVFADVVIVTVSQNVESEKIKAKFEDTAKRIEKKEKVLVVLDDLWKELPLDEVGIPCGSNYKNCKILLTSRRENVCVAMNTQKNICVESLAEDEAWILFKNVVGEKVETDAEFNKIAKEIILECGGLPLIIKVVGNALKTKSIKIWEAACDRLRNHVSRDIDEEVTQAFNHLKLSYDYLVSKEAKSCFLLCSMFPEDADIELENLVQYGIGLEKFDDLQSIEDARNRVQIAVNTLKSSCLLLDGDGKGTTKMHDVVRDMALLIASEGNKKTVVEAGKGLSQWHPRNATESYIGISLIQNRIRKLPDHEFHFPHLDSFLIPDNIVLESVPDKFIRAIKNVKVLDMKDNCISSLPRSFNLLTKLCMLNLSRNVYFDEISILGELRNLQMLILNGTNIKEIPKEIGQLTKLRCLSAKFCYRLSQIAPGVISNLYLLEELCVGFFRGGDRSSLEEIPNLPFLTKLELIVSDFDGIPKNLEFGKLQYFEILVGTKMLLAETRLIRDRLPYVSENKRILILKGIDIPFMKPYSKLIKAAEDIHIHCYKGFENILTVMFSEGIDEFKGITIYGARGEAFCLVDQKAKGKFFSKVKIFILSLIFSLEVLWNCPDEYISFHNLEKFEISFCEKLKRLFPVSVAKGLVNLRSLILSGCSSLESVICVGYEEEAGNNEIEMLAREVDFEFPRLSFIVIEHLAKLKSFCNGHSTIKYPSLEVVSVSNCPNMETWGYGIHDMPKMDFRHQGTSYNINDYVLMCHEIKAKAMSIIEIHIETDDMQLRLGSVEAMAGGSQGSLSTKGRYFCDAIRNLTRRKIIKSMFEELMV
ncbi:NB-ARC domains-containing protein [Artemisia annua]|uniref:NB-ARC domains-containing protein n=1 Tax=Artemisia annua TaxID=35608 RepID=A0A2U1MZZ6_ARTAN|nr:NB-ARC domains-containing protein [Artemisia annua]